MALVTHEFLRALLDHVVLDQGSHHVLKGQDAWKIGGSLRGGHQGGDSQGYMLWLATYRMHATAGNLLRGKQRGNRR